MSETAAAEAIESTEPERGLVPRVIAEALGTLLLVFGGVGTALFAANFPTAETNSLGVGFLGVSLAFGLTVVAGAYAFGPISGGHFNPAISLGLAAAGRFAWRDVLPYIAAQVVGGLVASSLLYVIAAGGGASFLRHAVDGGFASNGYGDHSPGGFNLVSALLIEIILTALFVYVVLGTTARIGNAGFAPLAIGLVLTLTNLVAIPIDNASLNPVRSLATAVYGGGDALAQVWAFLVFPIVGGLIAGFTYRLLFGRALTF